jgi:hypothetical protein
MPLPKLFRKLQEFILVWPGDEIKQVGYDGHTLSMPPHDVVAEVGLGSPYQFESAKLRGVPLPGTIVLKDQIVTLQSGGYRKVFDAMEACTWIEENRTELIAQGFSIVMDPEDVAAAMAEGRPRYDKSQDNLARETLQSELARRKKWEEKGVPPPPSSSEHRVLWAIKHLETAEARRPAVSESAIKAALGGVKLPPPPAAPEPPKQMFHDKPVAELTAEDIFAQAEAAGISLTKGEMISLLKGEGRQEMLDRIASKYEEARASA